MMPETNLPNSEQEKKPKNRHFVIWIITGFFLLIALIWIGWWVIWGRFREITDDAYVSGNKVMVTPQTKGIVLAIHSDDTMMVEEGQTLIELDPTDTLIQLGIQKAFLGITLRNVAELFKKIDVLKAEIEVREAELLKTTLDYEHRLELVSSGAVSLEDFEHAETSLMAAYGNLMVAEQQLKEIEAQTYNTTVENHPRVLEAKNKLRDAWVAWKRTVIKAPVTGIVAQRKVQVGQWVNPAEPLLAIVPMDQIWVDANFKEEQLRKMRIGQNASFTADLYGSDIVYHGKVIGIAAGTGSVFSALPPQNATGNWIKIVQRVPVRIGITPSSLNVHPLRLGLSVDVRVDLHDQTGPLVPASTPLPTLYQTSVFEKEEEGVEKEIMKIVNKQLKQETLEMEDDGD